MKDEEIHKQREDVAHLIGLEKLGGKGEPETVAKLKAEEAKLAADETGAAMSEIAAAERAVQSARTHIESVVAQMSRKGMPIPSELSSALTALNQQSFSSVADASAAIAAAGKGEQLAAAAEGGMMLATAGEMALGVATGVAALAASPEIKKAMLDFGKAFGFGEGGHKIAHADLAEKNLKPQHLDNGVALAELNNGVTKNEKGAAQSTVIAI